ncbi:MAG: FG-GAP-like repeat-containing protein [Limisphaerales bacterium]
MIRPVCAAGLVTCLVLVSGTASSANSDSTAVTAPAGGPPPSVWRLEGTQPDGVFGWLLDGGGDLNGDGYDDMIIGEPGFETEHGHGVGRVQVFHGSSAGFGHVPNQVLLGEASDAGCGAWVSILGDVNRDGYADVGINSTSNRGGPFLQGRITIHYGSPEGLSFHPNWSLEGDETLKEVWYVAPAGDVNGDGFADVVIGARDPAGTPSHAGCILVFHGATQGLAREPSWSRHGTQAGELYGESARRAGDVNRDGFGDLIVGSMNHDGREVDDGRVEVFFGGPTGLAPAPGWVATHTPKPHPGIVAGRYQLFGNSVDAAGDVNGDGIADLVAAGWFVSNGEECEGRVFGWHGSPDGPRAAFDWSAESDQAQALFGNCVAGVGDVNGDGFDDVLIAAMHMDRGQLNEGLVALYHGSARGLSRWPAWTAEGDETMAAFGAQVASLGDVNRDGLADFAVGSARHQKEGRVVGEVRVYLGKRGGLGGGSGWNPEVPAGRRFMARLEQALVQSGWRLAMGVALAVGLGGWASLRMLGSYRATQGKIVRLRRRMEDLSASTARGVPEHVELGQRLAAELRRSLDATSGNAHRLADVVVRMTWWAAGFASMRGFTLDFDVPTPAQCQGEIAASTAEALEIFARVVLANVAEHSRADRASLRLSPGAEQIVVEVRDAGCGFDPAILEDPACASHGRLGLGALRDRMARLGGQFEVRSERGRGTTVRASLPHRRPSRSAWFRKRRKVAS